MYVAIIIIAVTLLIFGPQFWARHVLKRYSQHDEQIPGTGAELARHLLTRYGVTGVNVEKTEAGDHYDPLSRTIRLSNENHDTRSLTAIAVAAHETGHALQHHRGESLLDLRTRLVYLAAFAEKAGAAAMLAIPVVALMTRVPSTGVLMALIGFISLGLSVIVHFVTLPVEWDASFNKALPILMEGNYIETDQLKATHTILKACALTYVASSLASLLNLWRWLAILRPLIRR
ncbi:MAG: zinc metallopeptidase [Gammaproteobacteria bacterium]|nr:zinc metallopeptidase [Gammaproteobacteria bacterium]MDH5593917.1 zinc metallopeptidase [Gammaproteobacteria bacterium]MDH5613927.1 zinc metallopeptidase [Gammaproteobacteria bacterium]